MRSLVVFESMFGNTEMVARGIARGLSEQMDVTVAEVSEAPSSVEGFDLLVVGGPTHAFSLSHPSTRADALKQGATQGCAETGLREWLARLPEFEHVICAAAFDTRVEKLRMLPGSAARKAVRLVHDRGLIPVGRESFYVQGTSGPLVDGEVVRAKDWARGLAADVTRSGAGRAPSSLASR